MAQTQQISEIDIQKFKVAGAVRNQHGGFVWPITYESMKGSPRFQLGGDSVQLKIPFTPSCFGQEISNRQSLDFAISPWLDDVLQFLAKLDNFIIDHVWNNVNEFFPKKKFASKEELQSIYCPILKKNEDFDPLCKTKFNTLTLKVFQINEEGSKKSDHTCITSGCLAVPICQLSKIWVMSNRFGATLTTEACMVWPKKDKDIQELFVTDMMKSVIS